MTRDIRNFLFLAYFIINFCIQVYLLVILGISYNTNPKSIHKVPSHFHLCIVYSFKKKNSDQFKISNATEKKRTADTPISKVIPCNIYVQDFRYWTLAKRRGEREALAKRKGDSKGIFIIKQYVIKRTVKSLLRKE